MDDYPDLVDSGIGNRLHDERIRSYPGGHRRRLAGNQTYPGQKNILAILLRAGGNELFGKELINDAAVKQTRVAPNFAKEAEDEKIYGSRDRLYLCRGIGRRVRPCPDGQHKG